MGRKASPRVKQLQGASALAVNSLRCEPHLSELVGHLQTGVYDGKDIPKVHQQLRKHGLTGEKRGTKHIYALFPEDLLKSKEYAKTTAHAKRRISRMGPNQKQKFDQLGGSFFSSIFNKLKTSPTVRRLAGAAASAALAHGKNFVSKKAQDLIAKAPKLAEKIPEEYRPLVGSAVRLGVEKGKQWYAKRRGRRAQQGEPQGQPQAQPTRDLPAIEAMSHGPRIEEVFDEPETQKGEGFVSDILGGLPGIGQIAGPVSKMMGLGHKRRRKVAKRHS